MKTYRSWEVCANAFWKTSSFSKFAISIENWKDTYKICKDIDEKDTPFVAFSLELGIPLCTNDKALCGGAKKTGFDNFVTTEKLLQGIIK